MDLARLPAANTEGKPFGGNIEKGDALCTQTTIGTVLIRQWVLYALVPLSAGPVKVEAMTARQYAPVRASFCLTLCLRDYNSSYGTLYSAAFISPISLSTTHLSSVTYDWCLRGLSDQ